MLSFVLVSAAVGFLDTLNNIAADLLFRGADFLSVIDKTQRDALGMLFIRLHSKGTFINELFWVCGSFRLVFSSIAPDFYRAGLESGS